MRELQKDVDSEETDTAEEGGEEDILDSEQTTIADEGREATEEWKGDEFDDCHQIERENECTKEREEQESNMSEDCDNNEDNKHCYCAKIQEWCEEVGEGDLLENLTHVIDGNLLKKGNILLRLFSELLRHMTSNTRVYTAETLLWWLMGWKMFGNRWLLKMKGTSEKPNFAVPSLGTLRSLCPRGCNLTGSRPPGTWNLTLYSHVHI